MPHEADLEFVGAVTVGERGQIVIPADARKDLGFLPGSKLLILHHKTMHNLVLIKVELFSEMMEHMKKIEAFIADKGLDAIEGGNDAI
jgi:AbrB family looped-hinge helix DNA binding protein